MSCAGVGVWDDATSVECMSVFEDLSCARSGWERWMMRQVLCARGGWERWMMHQVLCIIMISTHIIKANWVKVP